MATEQNKRNNNEKKKELMTKKLVENESKCSEFILETKYFFSIKELNSKLEKYLSSLKYTFL